MKVFVLQKGVSNIQALVILALVISFIVIPFYCDVIAVVSSDIPSLSFLSRPFCQVKPRVWVSEGLALAEPVKKIVVENAEQGIPFFAGWIPPNATKNVSIKANPTDTDLKNNTYSGISINPLNGIITITYTDKVAKNSPTLLLIPRTNNKLFVPGLPVKTPVQWECHSATAPKGDTFLQLLGTLPATADYVSAKCRDN